MPSVAYVRQMKSRKQYQFVGSVRHGRRMNLQRRNGPTNGH